MKLTNNKMTSVLLQEQVLSTEDADLSTCVLEYRQMWGKGKNHSGLSLISNLLLLFLGLDFKLLIYPMGFLIT